MIILGRMTMKIKISRRKARQFRDRKKAEGKGKRSQTNFPQPRIQFTRRARFFGISLSSHKDATRREWRKLNDKTSAHTIRNHDLSHPTIWHYQQFPQSCLFQMFFRVFDPLLLKLRHEMDFIHSYCRCLQNAANRKWTAINETQMLLSWKKENTCQFLKPLVTDTMKLNQAITIYLFYHRKVQ